MTVSLPAQARGRHAVLGAEGIVKAAQAGKAAGEGDLGYREMGFGQQLLGEKQAAGLNQLDGRDAELGLNDAANLTGAELELGGDTFQTGIIFDNPLLYPLDDLVGDAAGVVHRGVTRGELRSAAEAGAETGFFGRPGIVEKAAVALFGCTGGADGTAVDAGGGDANEEYAVEA